ncbi:type II secretion system protein [Marinobacterium arenosum]|uniref:type II secretion system protein n=1 Tax=Marinobacterium arenosum TaxID=2862496 RepID=UPI001C95C320|nr:prepilin-type N-terminal cleavage/methylation domain-containing protein [Marinobacterium arenosum]MBY4676519.1 prepilin-type N-terminal cleavage/methylation domain-containing protein [Marinobacterium arenosum]
MHIKKSEQGFTLVEIAIVLVIIGLLLGGSIKGYELIESVKIKQVKRFHDEFKAAFYFYQDMYRYYPGDDPGADRFDGVPSKYNGNGDGEVTGHWRGKENGNESVLLWLHLRASGLLSNFADLSDSHNPFGGETPRPVNPFGGVIGFEYNTERDKKGRLKELGIPVLCFDGIDQDVGNKIDIAYDDGVANTGEVVATEIHIKEIVDAYGLNRALCFKF